MQNYICFIAIDSIGWPSFKLHEIIYQTELRETDLSNIGGTRGYETLKIREAHFINNWPNFLQIGALLRISGTVLQIRTVIKNCHCTKNEELPNGKPDFLGTGQLWQLWH